jgi:uncharacterized protein
MLAQFFLLTYVWADSGPSFDCSKISPSKNHQAIVERQICSEKNLSALDLEMSKLFKQTFEKLSDYEKTSLLMVQKEWLTNRRDCIISDSEKNKRSLCLTQKYTALIGTYKKIQKGNLLSCDLPEISPVSSGCKLTGMKALKNKQLKEAQKELKVACDSSTDGDYGDSCALYAWVLENNDKLSEALPVYLDLCKERQNVFACGRLDILNEIKSHPWSGYYKMPQSGKYLAIRGQKASSLMIISDDPECSKYCCSTKGSGKLEKDTLIVKIDESSCQYKITKNKNKLKVIGENCHDGLELCAGDYQSATHPWDF